MNNFEVIIGIENHVELKTNSKMFATGPVTYGITPNTVVDEISLGYPGAIPSVNKKGVELAILACNALKMEIDPLLNFDRKNYFYPDLAKGFQITQNDNPIGREGRITIKLSDGTEKIVEIERLHIEEDTAKQTHKENLTYIDYNRSGIGLVEIVTKPVLRSGEEASLYVEKLREILLFLGVSDVKMNEGSLRCDVNISLRPHGYEGFGNKVEIKNLNSISNVKKAVDFEIARQTKLLLQNEVIQQETRRFDESIQETVLMRVKTDAVDYKYFREPNIAPIKLDKAWIQEVIDSSPELADQKRKKYTEEYNLNLEDTNVILSNLEMVNFFEEAIKKTKSIGKIANYLVGDVQSELNKNNLEINQIELTPENLSEMVSLIEDGIISSKHAKTILPLIVSSSNETPSEIVKRLNIKLISSETEINDLLNPIFESNQELIKTYSERPERVTKTVMGQLMKVTGGNVNPDKAMQIIIDRIEKLNDK